MKFLSFSADGQKGLAVEVDGSFRGYLEVNREYPGDLLSLIRRGGLALSDAADALRNGAVVDLKRVDYLPPVSSPEKIVCVGLNYQDHTAESPYEQPDYPTRFGRFNSSLIGHGSPIIRLIISEQLDYVGELVVIIGAVVRKVSIEEALNHVAGYSIFNDASIHHYQFKSLEWTAGKNFDDTGAFGPYFVSADALPKGCKGLRLPTRLNGEVMENAPVDDMVFPVADQIAIISQFMTLKPGDVIVAGTPSGVGFARKPPLWMKDGDVCEVEISETGTLSNPIRDEEV